MAGFFWSVTIIAVVGAVLYFGVPLILAEVFPWQSLWKQRDARPEVRTKSYKGRTVLITGANGAFGSRAAKNFAHRDVETLVLVDVRDCTALKETIETELKEKNNTTKPNILVWQADMMTFAGCQEVGRKAKDLKNLDHVLMTMGIHSFKRSESPEGWETLIQVNYLSNALLAMLLLTIVKSSPTNPEPPVISFITTFAVYQAWPTMSIPSSGSYLKKLSNNKGGLDQGHQYGRSKALLLYFARELASRITAHASSAKGLGKITINSIDPGTSWTPLTSPNRGMWLTRVMTDFSARDAQWGANTMTNGVSAPATAHGKIMQDFDTAKLPPYVSRKSGQTAQQRVWQETRSEFEGKVPEVKAVYQMLD